MREKFRPELILCGRESCTEKYDLLNLQTYLEPHKARVPKCIFGQQILVPRVTSMTIPSSFSNLNVITCPGCTNGFLLDSIIDPILEDSVVAKDENGRTFKPEILDHMATNRIRCSICSTLFCKQCNSNPYHEGELCNYEIPLKRGASIGVTTPCMNETILSHLNSDCRWCHNPIPTRSNATTGNLLLSSFPNENCGEADCIEKSKQVCRRRLFHCNHPCSGVVGERQCPPCQWCPASSSSGNPKMRGDEYCSLCWTETLLEGPIVRLTRCNHLVHNQCLVKRLILRYFDKVIGFSFMQCPECRCDIEENGTSSLHINKNILGLIWKWRRKVEAITVVSLERAGEIKEFFDNCPSYEKELAVIAKCNESKRHRHQLLLERKRKEEDKKVELRHNNIFGNFLPPQLQRQLNNNAAQQQQQQHQQQQRRQQQLNPMQHALILNRNNNILPVGPAPLFNLFNPNNNMNNFNYPPGIFPPPNARNQLFLPIHAQGVNRYPQRFLNHPVLQLSDESDDDNENDSDEEDIQKGNGDDDDDDDNQSQFYVKSKLKKKYFVNLNEDNFTQWAFRKFNFYDCSNCKKPYFGGKRDCGAEIRQQLPEDVEEAGPNVNEQKDLFCPPCIIKKNGFDANCAIHGNKYAQFKCKYCCSVAVWFCFGSTHYCDKCHGMLHPTHITNCMGGVDCPLKVDFHPRAPDDFFIGCQMCIIEKGTH